VAAIMAPHSSTFIAIGFSQSSIFPQARLRAVRERLVENRERPTAKNEEDLLESVSLVLYCYIPYQVIFHLSPLKYCPPSNMDHLQHRLSLLSRRLFLSPMPLLLWSCYSDRGASKLSKDQIVNEDMTNTPSYDFTKFYARWPVAIP
jgi:hypothetical protein